jgi:hypothetical protein
MRVKEERSRKDGRKEGKRVKEERSRKDARKEGMREERKERPVLPPALVFNSWMAVASSTFSTCFEGRTEGRMELKGVKKG